MAERNIEGPSARATRLLRALRREPVDCTPVWLMRQAGRYLPEYNQSRAAAGDFLALCQSPDRACEVTLQPLRRFDLDAAILFSDILTIPDAMGLGLRFAAGEGPWFERPVRDEADVAHLAVPDPEVELRYVCDAVRLIRRELGGRVPLIGFSGSPWTLACYMVEGRGSSDFRLIKTLRYRRPDLLHRILEVVTEAVIGYLNAQIAAGAQVVMIFDTWGGVLSDADFVACSQSYLARIVAAVADKTVPVVVFTKGGGLWLERLADTGAAAVGVDWTVDLADARRRIGTRVALQGNLDPMALMGSADTVRQQVVATLERYDADPSLSPGLGHVFNLGHGLSQFTPPDSVAVLVETVHRHSAEIRRRRASSSSLS
ncbi:MAG: uroporphyrinogen decarboxylase [Burkholderiaceae bacterium]